MGFSLLTDSWSTPLKIGTLPTLSNVENLSVLNDELIQNVNITAITCKTNVIISVGI